MVPFDQSPFAAGLADGPAQIAESLRAAFLSTGRVQVPFNVLLVRLGSGWVLIDSGAGGAFGGCRGRLGWVKGGRCEEIPPNCELAEGLNEVLL